MSDHIQLAPSTNGIEVRHTTSGERFDLVCERAHDNQIGDLIVVRESDLANLLDRLQSVVFRYGWARACETNARKRRAR